MKAFIVLFFLIGLVSCETKEDKPIEHGEDIVRPETAGDRR